MPLGPIVITFANQAYLPLLEPWVASLHSVGVRRIRVYGLDAATVAWCEGRGIEVMPLPWNGTRGELWQARIGVFCRLLDEREEFIHSDADAFWSRNPLVEGSACVLGDDLVFSQGTYWPPDIHDQQGFVLCCGWFRARPTDAARRFLSAVESDAATTQNDQASVNRLLVAGGARWDAGERDYALPFRDRMIHCWTRPIRATVRSSSLSVAMLPHREFQRIPEAYDRVVVRHFLLPPGCSDKMQALRDLGVPVL